MYKDKKCDYDSPPDGKNQRHRSLNSELEFKKLLVNAGFSEKIATDIWKWYENKTQTN